MFVKNSMTGIGVGVSILVFLAKYLGLDLDEAQLTEAVVKIVEVVGYFMVVYGQWSRKDLVGGLVRK